METKNQMRKQKVIIVDDHKIFRKGLRTVIEDYGKAEIVGEAASGEEFLELMDTCDADIVFMDINLPYVNGYEATRKVLVKKSDLSIVGLSANDDIASIKEMLAAGAKGYMGKDVDYDEIHQALKYLSEQKKYFSTDILIKLTNDIDNQTSEKPKGVGDYVISDRELDVLECICEGLSNYQIAEKLFISIRTVEKHKANLYNKTGTENVLNLALYAFHNDLVNVK